MTTVKETKTVSQTEDVFAKRARTEAGKRLKLSLSPELEKELNKKGLTPRWVLDRPGRIQELMDLGYRFLSAKEVEQNKVNGQEQRDGAFYIDAAGFHTRTGEPLRQYLMAIKTEFYEEYRAKKAATRKARADEIKSGKRQSIDEQVDTSDRINMDVRVGRTS
jgi:hypothetical protein